MNDKIFLKDEDKIKILELNNQLLQNQQILIKAMMNDSQLQNQLTLLLQILAEQYGKKGWLIDNNYQLFPPKRRRK